MHLVGDSLGFLLFLALAAVWAYGYWDIFRRPEADFHSLGTSKARWYGYMVIFTGFTHVWWLLGPRQRLRERPSRRYEVGDHVRSVDGRMVGVVKAVDDVQGHVLVDEAINGRRQGVGPWRPDFLKPVAE